MAWKASEQANMQITSKDVLALRTFEALQEVSTDGPDNISM